jgi:hypothetical protein
MHLPDVQIFGDFNAAALFYFFSWGIEQHRLKKINGLNLYFLTHP